MLLCSNCLEEFPSEQLTLVNETSSIGGISYTTVLCSECIKNPDNANLKIDEEAPVARSNDVSSVQSTIGRQERQISPDSRQPKEYKYPVYSNHEIQKILKILGAELKDKCISQGLLYPDEIDNLMRTKVTAFNIDNCSTRTRNILRRSLRERNLQDDDIQALAQTGYFEIEKLTRLKNAGTKTIVEIIRFALALNGSQRTIPRSNASSVKPKYIRKIPIRTQIELEKICNQLNLDWPGDINVIMTRGVHYFNIEECSTRARNVIQSSLNKFNLNQWEIEELADLGFFKIQNLFELRNLGVKTVNELITISVGIGVRDNFTLRETNSRNFTVFKTPHAESFLLFLERLFEIPVEESFHNCFSPITFGVQNFYDSLNNIYQTIYGSDVDDNDTCQVLTFILKSNFQKTGDLAHEGFTTVLLNRLDETRVKWKVPMILRDFHMLLMLRAGIPLEEIGKRFSLTRERVRQITEKEKRRLRNSKNYLQTRSIIEFKLDHGLINRRIRLFLSALYNVTDKYDPKNKSAEINQLRQKLREHPLLSTNDLLTIMSDLDLFHIMDTHEVFESLIVKIKDAHSALLRDFLDNSLGAVSKAEIQFQFPQFSDNQIIYYLAYLTRKKIIVALGKKGFYISTLKTSLTTSQLTAAGFVEYLLQKDPHKIWSYREIFKMYTEETGLIVDEEGFRGSVQLSTAVEKAGIEVFFGRFVIDIKSNVQIAQSFKSCNKQKIISSCIHLNWTEMLESRIPQIAFNLAQKIHESERILELYINDVFQEKNEEMSEIDSSFAGGSDILAEIEKIARSNPDHTNPLSAIYSILVDQGEEPDFQACSKILFQLRKKNLWLE